MSKKKFWYVWNPLAGPPQRQHFTFNGATAEAIRLAKANPDTDFYVIGVERLFRMPLKPEVQMTVFGDARPGGGEG